MSHISVLYEESLEALHIRPGGKYIDGTLGGGGHTEGILERGGQVLAFDWDLSTIEFVRQKLDKYSTKVQYQHSNYADMAIFAPDLGYADVDGVLLDCGLSSRQLDSAERGFAFRLDGPLDMRFDQTKGQTAADLVNSLTAEGLAEIIWRYGEEKRSRKIALEIVNNRQQGRIETTGQLKSIIEKAVKWHGRGGNPSTKTFQALRIAVNDELTSVQRGIEAAVSLLKPGGRIAVISFHSLEDRIVKQTFRALSDPFYNQPKHVMHIDESHIVLNRITRKPIVPTDEEIHRNPRSRSAKLRVAEKRHPAASDQD